MTLDDLLDEFDYADVTASSISMGVVHVSSLKESQFTTRLLDELASEVSGFNKIPMKHLTDSLIIKGTSLLLGKHVEEVTSGTAGENYNATALKALSERRLFLTSVHPELINKAMLLAAIESNAVGPDRDLLTNTHLSGLIDDEVALASIDARIDFAFKHPGGENISDDLWVRAIHGEPGVSKHLVNKGRDSLLVKMVSEGFWPESFLGKKPGDVASAVTKLIKTAPQDGYQVTMLKSLILINPIEEVLPLFKTAARKKLLGSLYTLEQLRPQMKAFPFIKAAVLEESLGL